MDYSIISIAQATARSAGLRYLERSGAKRISFCASLLAQLVLIFTFSTSAFAEVGSEFDFQFGHWVGQPEVSATGQFESCMISEHNDSDELLILRLDKDNELSVGVFEKNWQGKALTSIPSMVMVDHRILFFGMGLLYANDALTITLGKQAGSLESIAAGKLLNISATDQSAIFGLTDADKAVAYLQKCALKGVPPAVAS